MTCLADLGWTESLAGHFVPFQERGWVPARVAREHTHIYGVHGEFGECGAEVSGAFRHHAAGPADFPAVGDWVALQLSQADGRATIHALLPRAGAFVRSEAGGRTRGQVVAANVDTAFLVSGLDGDFNPRRIERYLTAVWDSGAAPVVVLNKADLRPDLSEVIAQVETVAFGVPILPVSAVENRGIDAVARHIAPGKTAVFLGSSGVGKSTLINALAGDARQRVNAVREDDSRGRHTTTHRELILLPNGGLVIDTPGMRELRLWADDDGLERAFADIEAFAAGCRFRDCQHENEPGCAVRAALDTGELDPARWRSYLKLKRELTYAAVRQQQGARLAEKTRWKKIAILQRRFKKGQ